MGIPVNEVGEFNNNNNDIDTTKKMNNNNNNITNEGDSVTASITVVSLFSFLNFFLLLFFLKIAN